MRKHVLLIAALVVLYLIPALALQAVYGPSYGFWEGEDRWEPDGEGGWVKRGNPEGPPPDEPSVYIPIGLLYLPIFLPAALLILFLFTPLSRKLESSPPDEGMAEEEFPDQLDESTEPDGDEKENRP
jgi:hypothetical protein